MKRGRRERRCRPRRPSLAERPRGRRSTSRGAPAGRSRSGSRSSSGPSQASREIGSPRAASAAAKTAAAAGEDAGERRGPCRRSASPGRGRRTQSAHAAPMRCPRPERAAHRVDPLQRSCDMQCRPLAHATPYADRGWTRPRCRRCRGPPAPAPRAERSPAPSRPTCRRLGARRRAAHPERPPDLRAGRDGPRALARARRSASRRSSASSASASPSWRRCTSSPTAARPRSRTSPRRSVGRRRPRAGSSTGSSGDGSSSADARTPRIAASAVVADPARPGRCCGSVDRARADQFLTAVRPLPTPERALDRDGRRRARDPRDLAARPPRPRRRRARRSNRSRAWRARSPLHAAATRTPMDQVRAFELQYRIEHRHPDGSSAELVESAHTTTRPTTTPSARGACGGSSAAPPARRP